VFRKFSTLIPYSTSYNHHRVTCPAAFCQVLNTNLLQIYYERTISLARGRAAVLTMRAKPLYDPTNLEWTGNRTPA